MCSDSLKYPGDEEANTILAEESSMLIGVGGDADEAGDDVEYKGEGVSGGELNEGSEGTYCALGREYCCSLDNDRLMRQNIRLSQANKREYKVLMRLSPLSEAPSGLRNMVRTSSSILVL